MNKGFTLVEVLVASLIICIFAASFTYMARSGIDSVRDSRAQTRSVLIAKSIMEELRSVPYNDLFAYNRKTFDNGAGVITVKPSGGKMVSITVKHKIELNTLRSIY